MERSGARSGRSRSGNAAESGGYRNRLERRAAFSPLTLRSHACIYDAYLMGHINCLCCCLGFYSLLFTVLCISCFLFFTLISFSLMLYIFSLSLLYFCYSYCVSFSVLLDGVRLSRNKRITYLLTYQYYLPCNAFFEDL